MSNHTSGLWVANNCGSKVRGALRRYASVTTASGKAIASCSASSKTWEARQQANANANLCAAAPDLLDALRRLMRHISDDFDGDTFADDWQKAQGAIAKATGSQVKHDDIRAVIQKAGCA